MAFAIVFVVNSFGLNAQSSSTVVITEHLWRYEFGIDGVSDADEAKQSLALLHPIFKVMPEFSFEDNKFLVESRVNKSQEELEIALEEYDIHFVQWSQRYIGRTSDDNKESEEEGQQ